MTSQTCPSLELRRSGSIVYFQPHLTLEQKKQRLSLWLHLNGKCAFGCGRKAFQWHHSSYVHEDHPYSFEWIPCCRECHRKQHAFPEPANDNKQLDFFKGTG